MLISESVLGLIVAATRQNAGRSANAFPPPPRPAGAAANFPASTDCASVIVVSASFNPARASQFGAADAVDWMASNSTNAAAARPVIRDSFCCVIGNLLIEIRGSSAFTICVAAVYIRCILAAKILDGGVSMAFKRRYFPMWAAVSLACIAITVAAQGGDKYKARLSAVPSLSSRGAGI